MDYLQTYKQYIIMDNKLPQSHFTMQQPSSTIRSQLIYNNFYNIHDQGRTGMNHSMSQILPYKFTKKRQLKPTKINIHQQTVQNPQKSSIRTFYGSKTSQLFSPKATINKTNQNFKEYPQIWFHREDNKKLLSPGSCSILKFQSEKPLQDIKFKQMKKKSQFSQICKPDPIIIGQISNKQNNTLNNMWKEQRRLRDHGSKFSQCLQWNPNLQKRQLYKIKAKNKFNKL